MSQSIEKKYVKYTQIEHVLARPGMYVGEMNNIEEDNWIVEDGKIVQRSLKWNPGLYKIFDEIITNASDESQRNSRVKNIIVELSDNEISVLNDGQGIPIEIHKEYNIYVPELIFGNLLSSSNYDDTQKRVVGGTNGIGAKLTNIYSTEFLLETCSNGKKYVQLFSNNMQTIGNPEISKSSKEYTKISFKPDFKRFNVKDLSTDDNYKILEKRVYDISAVTNKNVTVTLNGNKIKNKDFSSYIDLYLGCKKENLRVYEEFSPRWKVGVGVSKSGTFQHISFVNGIFCKDGGSHIEHVLYPITKQISEELQSKHKNITIRPQYIREHLFLFVWCLIENPTFSSQTKDKHTTKITEFGSRCIIHEEFIKKVSKLGFIEDLLLLAEAKDKKSLTKSDGKKTTKVVVPKLDDANRAGTYDSDKCTLILTEGNSAKTFAISGLSVIGRDYYGVFPLRGKLLNTRTATFQQISNNEEINNIKKIVGLQTNKKYTNIKDLRYGKILIMTDQDVDGFHIKSLIINFLYHGWPELMENFIFVESLLTPIVKISTKKEIINFYNIPDFEEWKKNNKSKNWTVKYYKGLGTSTSKEAKECFKNLQKIGYIVQNEQDSNALDLAFNKTKTDERKKWIQEATKNFNSIKYETSIVGVKSLIDSELVLFSIDDNIRSIPCLVDGLKPSQRKILYACFKKKLTTEIKVAQLAGYVSEQTAYHHGEVSLMETIINMAQKFVGSNNMNLLVPSGQFGTRIMGGKDAASPRYIFTYLSKHATSLFNKDDFEIVEYLNEDGMDIEPRFYVPTLPVILINNTQGIGTGFSTNIPCFNPEDIKDRLRKIVNDPDDEIEPLTPWYSGFRGEIVNTDNNKWVSYGIYEEKEGNIIIVTELPISVWTEDYKQFLEKLEVEEKIAFFKNNSTESSVHFEIKMKKSNEDEWRPNVCKFLKLTSNINAQNMHLFDENGKIVKMHSPEEILWNFYNIRTKYFKIRQKHLIKILKEELLILESKIVFIRAIIDDKLIVFKRKKIDIIKDMIEFEYKFYDKHDSYAYLLDLSVINFTQEKIDQLQKQVDDKREQYEDIKNKTMKDFWNEILN